MKELTTNEISSAASTREVLAIKKLMSSYFIKAIAIRTPSTLYEAAAAAITNAHNMRGQRIAAEDVAVQAETYINRMLTKYPCYFVKEIPIIFQKGVEGDFGEYFGLNPLTYLNWTKAYDDEGFHGVFVKANEGWINATIPRQIAERSHVRGELEHCQAAYVRYREQRERREETAPAGPLAGVLKKAVVRFVDCGSSPFWDYQGTAYEGARARYLNSIGYPGEDLQEIFGKLYAAGVEKIIPRQ